ncbi:hypothetical protein EN798_33780, partial [bacterium M00.F.Ca.ET.155.01.1.1]
MPINLANTSNLIGLFGILSIGQAFVIITGGIDLSVGSVLCLCSMVLAVTMHAGYSIEVGILATIITALAIGVTKGMGCHVAIRPERLKLAPASKGANGLAATVDG